MTEISELTEKQMARAIPARLRKRLMRGQFESGEDISTLRGFVGLTKRNLLTRLASGSTLFATGSRAADIAMARHSRYCGLRLVTRESSVKISSLRLDPLNSVYSLYLRRLG